MYKLYIIQDNQTYDITELVSDISWSDDIDTLGMQMNFTIACSKTKYGPAFFAKVTDKVLFIGNEDEIFRGIIVTKESSAEELETFTAFDFAFYLNKSYVIQQFNGLDAKSAINQLCTIKNITVGEIAPMNTIIKHNYVKQTISDIIDDIIKQQQEETGKRYVREVRGESFYLFEAGTIVIKLMFQPAYNIQPFDVMQAINNPSITESIEEMKNSIIIISGNEKSTRVVGTAKDEKSIQQCGLLQYMDSVDEKNINKAQNIAETKLKELNKIAKTYSIETLGDDKARAGRTVEIENETVGLQGKFLIKSCSHTLSSGVHTMSMELEKLCD